MCSLSTTRRTGGKEAGGEGDRSRGREEAQRSRGREEGAECKPTCGGPATRCPRAALLSALPWALDRAGSSRPGDGTSVPVDTSWGAKGKGSRGGGVKRRGRRVWRGTKVEDRR